MKFYFPRCTCALDGACCSVPWRCGACYRPTQIWSLHWCELYVSFRSVPGSVLSSLAEWFGYGHVVSRRRKILEDSRLTSRKTWLRSTKQRYETYIRVWRVKHNKSVRAPLSLPTSKAQAYFFCGRKGAYHARAIANIWVIITWTLFIISRTGTTVAIKR